MSQEIENLCGKDPLQASKRVPQEDDYDEDDEDSDG